MLRVTIEMLPHGREDRKRTIGTLLIANDGSGTPTHGNYRVKLMRRDNPLVNRKIARVFDFPRRSTDVWRLVERAIKNVFKK